MQPNLELMDGTVPPVDVIHLHHGGVAQRDTPRRASAATNSSRSSPPARRRRTSSCRRATATRYNAERQVGPQLHDPQPDVAGRQGLHHLGHRLHARHRARRQGDQAGRARCGWTCARLGATRSSTCIAARGTNGALHLPRPTRTNAVAERRASATSSRPTATDAAWGPRATCTRAACTTTSYRCTARRPTASRRTCSARWRNYYEPAGAVSWDVAMTGDAGRLAGQVQPGDKLRDHATYDTTRASWYESMGIMVVYYADDTTGGPTRSRPRSTAGRSPTATCPRTTTTAASTGPARPDASSPTGRGADRGHDRRLRLQPGRPERAGRRRAADRQAGPPSTLRQRQRRRPRLPHDHRVQGAVQPARPASPTRWPTGRSQFDSGELGSADGASPRRTARTYVDDAGEPAGRHLHVLLPHPPVHARQRSGSSASAAR